MWDNICKIVRKLQNFNRYAAAIPDSKQEITCCGRIDGQASISICSKGLEGGWIFIGSNCLPSEIEGVISPAESSFPKTVVILGGLIVELLNCLDTAGTVCMCCTAIHASRGSRA